jgi:hypothetical protein
MNYILISDFLWYLGHILSGSSILFTDYNENISIGFVIVGQFITIISRPISRIKNELNIDNIEIEQIELNDIIEV